MYKALSVVQKFRYWRERKIKKRDIEKDEIEREMRQKEKDRV